MKHMNTQRGFSMIELLVAVLVMGIGVLGITGLQMVSLQNNRGALMRGEAVQLAYDMLDRVRANPGSNYDGLNLGTAPPAATNCNANNCTEAQMVTFDQAVWKCSLGNWNADAKCVAFRNGTILPAAGAQPGLPAGDGRVAVNAAGIVTITVQWQEPNMPNLSSISISSQG
ncbi:MAG TPA: type IV pilus modification protein PilV [Pseudomonadales bacterium]|nr:type IV pilus modification protein PilV [Pseudomonadales bacterium]